MSLGSFQLPEYSHGSPQPQRSQSIDSTYSWSQTPTPAPMPPPGMIGSIVPSRETTVTPRSTPPRPPNAAAALKKLSQKQRRERQQSQLRQVVNVNDGIDITLVRGPPRGGLTREQGGDLACIWLDNKAFVGTPGFLNTIQLIVVKEIWFNHCSLDAVFKRKVEEHKAYKLANQIESGGENEDDTFPPDHRVGLDPYGTASTITEFLDSI